MRAVRVRTVAWGGVIAMGCLAASSAGDAAPAAPFTISHTAFLAGCWRGDTSDGIVREAYTPPEGGTMLGNSHAVAKGKTDFFEFVSIVQTDDGVEYRPLPAGKPGEPFKLVRATPSEVVFENPGTDYPQRIVYALAPSTGVLTARIELMDGGKAQSFPMKAVACGGEAYRGALRSVSTSRR